MGLLGFDKWISLVRIIYKNGGLIRSFLVLWRTETLKEGKYMGVDCFGNKFYENPRYMLGRSRWVQYNPAVKFEYDASQVTSEWFGWLHYKTDKTPCEDSAKLCSFYNWLLPHEQNMTATENAYYPYSTTAAAMKIWDGCNYKEKSKCTNVCFPPS